MNIKMLNVLTQGGLRIRQVLVHRNGKLYRQLNIDTDGTYQVFDTNFKRGLFRLTYDTLHSRIVYTDMYTMTTADEVSTYEIREGIDKRLVEWLMGKGDDVHGLINIFQTRYLEDEIAMIDNPDGSRDNDFELPELEVLLGGWEAGNILRGVNDSYLTWIDEQVREQAKFKTNGWDDSYYMLEEPIELDDELLVNLCGCQPRRRVMPPYQELKALVGNSIVARTLMNQRIKHCDIVEHDSIPDHLTLGAIRYGDVLPNQTAFIFRSSGDDDAQVIECVPHDQDKTLNLISIPKDAMMVKVVVTTRKPVVAPNGKHSIGYFVDIYTNNKIK